MSWAMIDPRLGLLGLDAAQGEATMKAEIQNLGPFHQAHARSQPQFIFCIVLIGKIQCTKLLLDSMKSGQLDGLLS